MDIFPTVQNILKCCIRMSFKNHVDFFEMVVMPFPCNALLWIFSAFLQDFSLWLDQLSSDGSLRHLAQPCLVALGQALICMAY